MDKFSPSAALAKVGSNLDFLKDWTKDNEEVFSECMRALAEENPAKFADLFLRAQAMIMDPKDPKPKANININVKSDMDGLKALSSTIDPARFLETSKSKTEYAPYEEV